MSNRTGTYVAFDGLGEVDPTKSDFRYYSTIKAWNNGKNVDFKFVNSHEKTSAVRDSSKRITLEKVIRQRLSVSKNCIVILSRNTRKKGSMLSYEIEKAIDLYNIPLICVYTDYEIICSPSKLSNRWPEALEMRIRNGKAKAIHIPYKKNILLAALSQFTVNKEMPSGSLSYYNRNFQVDLNSK